MNQIVKFTQGPPNANLISNLIDLILILVTPPSQVSSSFHLS